MKWKRLIYPSDSLIRNHVCHPQIASQRVNYIRRRYEVEPVRVESRKETHVDYGGVIQQGDPVIRVRLGLDRVLTVFDHHADLLAEALRCALSG
jgi:hypothetical protein